MRNREDAPALSRGDGVVSHLMHPTDGAGGTRLTVTWVEVEPGAAQTVHSHDPEQVYVVVSGEGRVHVDGETRDVSEGDAVRIPSGADHGIENTGDATLEYVSAATPAFPMEEVESFYGEDG